MYIHAGIESDIGIKYSLYFTLMGDLCHDDVTKWKHFPRYWPFLRGIHRWPVNSPHNGQWRGALIFSLICKRWSKQYWGWWFETPSRPLWRHCNVLSIVKYWLLYKGPFSFSYANIFNWNQAAGYFLKHMQRSRLRPSFVFLIQNKHCWPDSRSQNRWKHITPVRRVGIGHMYGLVCYHNQESVITSHRYCGMHLSVLALDNAPGT